MWWWCLYVILFFLVVSSFISCFYNFFCKVPLIRVCLRNCKNDWIELQDKKNHFFSSRLCSCCPFDSGTYFHAFIVILWGYSIILSNRWCGEVNSDRFGWLGQGYRFMKCFKCRVKLPCVLNWAKQGSKIKTLINGKNALIFFLVDLQILRDIG